MKRAGHIRWKFALSVIAFCSFCTAVWFVLFSPNDVSGQRGFGYSSKHVGGLKVVYGRPAHNWIYMMIICPGVEEAKSQFSGSGINHDIKSYPKFHYDWETQTGMVHVSFRWNMWTDTVSIGKQKLSREKGNVFVVVREPTGELKVQQCGSLGPQADLPEIVQHIRSELADDDLIKAVKFHFK